jgi:hypothetical protein
MRGIPIVALMIMLSSAAIAQTSASPGTTTPDSAPAAAPAAPPPDGISRDDYIAKARDAAEKRAATRFDAMDANHDGVLTKEEIAAYRAAHARKPTSEPQ